MANKTIRAILTALLLYGCNGPVGSDPSSGDDAALNEALYANLDATDSGSSVASASNAIDAKTMADMNLKALLKDPDSAKFRKVVVTKIPGGNLMLCGEVNSKNAFGGYTGFKRFIASPNPDAPSIIEGETPGVTKAIFSEAYASACSNVVGLRLNQSQNASAVAMATPERKLAASLS